MTVRAKWFVAGSASPGGDELREQQHSERSLRQPTHVAAGAGSP